MTDSRILQPPSQPLRRIALRLLPALALMLASPVASGIETGERVQWPAMQTLDGREISANSLQGRYVFLQVWASWCPYCAVQNTSLPELQKRWEQRGGVLLTLSSDRHLKQLSDYMSNKGYRFPVVHLTPALRQWLGKVRSVPTVFIIGPDGSVLKKIEGQMLEEDLFELPDLLPHPPGGRL